MRWHFKGGVKFSRTGRFRFFFFLRGLGLGKKGLGQNSRVGLIPWRTLCTSYCNSLKIKKELFVFVLSFLFLKLIWVPKSEVPKHSILLSILASTKMCWCLSFFGFLGPDLSPGGYRKRCFLVALCYLTVSTLNLEVATKRLLCQQVKILG